jgi:hypothetical protein
MPPFFKEANYGHGSYPRNKISTATNVRMQSKKHLCVTKTLWFSQQTKKLANKRKNW